MQSRTTQRKQKRIVLVGAGHTHLDVLRRFAMDPLNLDLVLVSPSSEALYSGMLPGFVSGHYKRKEILLEASSIAQRAGAIFIPDTVLHIDHRRQLIELKDRPPLFYDICSIDIGSQANLPASAPLQNPRFFPTRPFSILTEKLQAAHSLLQKPKAKIIVVGLGAAGFELACAFRARFPQAEILGLCAQELPPERSRALAELQIPVSLARVQEVLEQGEKIGCSTSDGHSLLGDFLVWAAGPKAHTLVKDSGLGEENGYLLVDNALRSKEGIFGAGDCIQMQNYPEMAKAGVYAVREAPFLFENLRAEAEGKPLQEYHPQKNFLRLLNLCDGRAIAEWYGLKASGAWAFRWKDSIDRKFMQMFDPEVKPMLDPDCGGCGSKVSADLLTKALGQLNIPSTGATWGVKKAEDVATFSAGEKVLGITVDQFRGLGVDPFLLGQIAAVHASSDLYAKNIEPERALAQVVLPKFSAELTGSWLQQLMSGILSNFSQERIELLGGQTNEGDDWSVGLTLWGETKGKLWEKSAGRESEALVLTKPLGTGILLAAHMAGKTIPLSECISSMAKSQRAAWEVLQNFSVSSCTDITGFSLLGHLSEMLKGTALGADLSFSKIPLFARAQELYSEGFQSRMHSQNARSFPVKNLPAGADILFDPQTSGGLLLSLPAAEAARLVIELQKVGFPAASVIGSLTKESLKIMVRP